MSPVLDRRAARLNEESRLIIRPLLPVWLSASPPLPTDEAGESAEDMERTRERGDEERSKEEVQGKGGLIDSHSHSEGRFA